MYHLAQDLQGNVKARDMVSISNSLLVDSDALGVDYTVQRKHSTRMKL